MSEVYRALSEERKKLQEQERLPEWFTTAGYALFKDKYLYEAKDFKEQAMRIAKTSASYQKDKKGWAKKFFHEIWSGQLSCSTPVLGNTGTNRGLVVSCGGSYMHDSIDGFYSNKWETALLTKAGFGTSGYLSDVRARGSQSSMGAKTSGVVPVIRGIVQDMRMVSQGSTRRGAWAGYLAIDHGDFYELSDQLIHEHDDLNIGWIVSDKFIQRLQENDPEAIARYQRAMYAKCVTGKGYFFFVDKANRLRPIWYKENKLGIKASNLCTEIMLHSSNDYTFTCVLSSSNLVHYPKMKDEESFFTHTVFLDGIASNFIEKAKKIKGLEKAVAFTEKSRALGLGACGFHTYLQENGIPFESLDAQFKNDEMFKEQRQQAEAATKWLANEHDTPDWCKGHKRRNSHLLAIAPTMSTALIMGGVSQGIEPMMGAAYMQNGAGGEALRINPVFLKLAKKRNKYTKKMIKEVAETYVGSVQHLDWLSDHEKMVFKSAFELNQEVLVRYASQRQKHLDQGQSLNLFFSAEESEKVISAVHQKAFLDPGILSLYYLRTQAGVSGSSGECVACQ